MLCYNFSIFHSLFWEYDAQKKALNIFLLTKFKQRFKKKKVSFYKNYQGMIGEVVYFLDRNSSPKDLWVFYFLSSLSFFQELDGKHRMAMDK